MLVGEMSSSTSPSQFTRSGGSVTLNGPASSNGLYAPVLPGASPGTTLGTLYIGGAANFDSGAGTYTMSAGTLDTTTAPGGGAIVLGFSGVGTLDQTGGQVTTGFVDMGDCGGCNGGNAAGFYDLNGTSTLIAGGINVGDVGHAEFTQNADGNGNTTNTVNGTLSIGNGPTASPNVANAGNYDRSGTY